MRTPEKRHKIVSGIFFYSSHLSIDFYKRAAAVKIFIIFILAAAFSAEIYPQITVQPENSFYLDALKWNIKGYVKNLPQLKPYPAKIIEEILSSVFENGNEEDKTKVQYYYEKYFRKKLNMNSDTDVNAKLDGINHFELYKEKLSLYGDFLFGNFVSLGFATGITGYNKSGDKALLLPLSQNSSIKFIENYALKAGEINILFDLNGIASIGNENFYVNFGFNKYGFGTYPKDNIILNSQSYQFLNTSFTYNGTYFQYVQILGLTGAANKNFNQQYYFGKYFAFHSLRIPLFEEKFSISYYEAAVWGKYFMPAYLIPSPYIVTANVSGFNENVLAGIGVDFRIFPDTVITADVLFDDLKLKPLLKLKLDDAAVRTAFKTGLVYTPEESICSSILLDYTLVTPYTYTAYYSENYNLKDYTNFAINLGSSLPPNSDQVYFQLDFIPISKLKIRTTMSFMRHANIYESLSSKEAVSISDKYKAQGGFSYIYSNGTADNSAYTSNSFTNFLKQQSIMYLIRSSIYTEYEYNSNKTAIIFSLGYTFEYIKNNGVDKHIYKGIYETPEDADKALKEWKDLFHNSYNHYLHASIKINF